MAKTGKIVKPVVYFHPGEMLTEKLEEMNISAAEFAAISGLNERDIKQIMSCKMDINQHTAMALEKGTSIPAHYWLRMQENFNLYMMKKLTETLSNSLNKNTPYEKKKEFFCRTVKRLTKFSAAML